MVNLMSRDPIHTVTLPVLVDAASPEEADGWGTHFPGTHRTKTMAVRVIKPEEIQERVREIFSDKEIFLFAGASQLEHAYGAKDERELQESLRKVHPWVPRIMGSREVSNPKRTNENFKSLLGRYIHGCRGLWAVER